MKIGLFVGAAPPAANRIRCATLETDHIHPRSRGGTDTDENLQLLCGFCNRTKGDRPQIWLLRRLDEMRLRGEL